MKEFLRSTLATITGIAICGFVLAFIGIITLAGIMATSSSETVSVTDYTTDDISTLTISNESGEYTINRLGKE